MPPRAAPTLDRRITLLMPPALPPGETWPKDDYGHEIIPHEERLVWAKRMDAMPRDQLSFQNDQRLSINEAVFIIRYRGDVDTCQMMIDDEGQRRSIVGRAPMERRRRYLALLCEAIK